ncbi:hypothetical protein GDO86_001638 [Hymenochirus boettgeri]|uniref:C2H2-type domain-containing protein n=1 Tax=Hymenochirus boettgeri TaxID=247094 RepID=A0A8T2KEI0_9PIPI|nr:hypothetical protein GDO86_001638 [Hymenochirus boettgeri]
MSRRKQRKPQQLISDCDNSTSSENGDTASEEVQVCRKCCAQFDEPFEFARHKECCHLESQVVVIVENHEDIIKSQQPCINEGYNSTPSSPEGRSNGHKMHTSEQHERDTSSGIIGAPRYDMGKHRIDTTQGFFIPNRSLMMEGLSGTKVGLAPLNQENVTGSQTASSPINIPMILEELRVLQQRQIHQMQITEQICQQVLMLGSISPPPVSQATSPSKGNKSLSDFNQSKSTHCLPELAKSFCRDINSKQDFLNLYSPIEQSCGAKNIPLVKEKFLGGFSDKPTTGQASIPNLSQSQLISPHAIYPPNLPNLQTGLFLGTRVMETTPSLLKQKNSDSARGDNQQERTSGRHKCRFCAKVFGSDSALQIHLRSHTGERPYKCNICGNRFTTRGNLKVHFHRHREKYPHIQMNPHPVPEHLDYVLTSSGLPYGMSVPPEKADEEIIDKKSIAPPLLGTDSLSLFSGSSVQGIPSLSRMVLMKTGDGVPGIKSSNNFPKTKIDENTPPGERSDIGGIGGRMQLSKLVTSLPSWALLASHFKSGSLPFPYTVEPLGYSETSKLQQLVEKIDKQVTVPNQCVICLRVLSCPRALRLHYNQHGGERPFKCKICGRAFSTKGNLKAHFVGHKSNLSSKPQNSCPICQKKFTNAVTLQQHIRMHLGGQIPNGDLTEVEESKTEIQKANPEFSDDISTDDEFLGSETESEKAAIVDAEISSIDDDAVGSAEKKNAEKNIVVPYGSPPPIIHLTKDKETPPEPDTVTQNISLSVTHKENIHEKQEKTDTLLVMNPQNTPTKGPEDNIDIEMKGDVKPSVTNIPQEIQQDIEVHICNLCSERLPTYESLEDHAKCHTKDGLFHCLVCKQSFLESSILKKHMLHVHQVHMSTHVWNSSSSRRGRRLSLDNLGPLFSGTPVKLQDFLSRDIHTQLVGVSPISIWNQYTTYFTSGPLPTNGGAATVISPPALIGLRTAKVGNTPVGGLVEVKDQVLGTADSIPKSPIKEEK